MATEPNHIAGSPAPGWYPDPVDATLLRHWDGWQWGTGVRPLAAPTAQADNGSVRRIADYQFASGVLWIVLAVFQILSVFGIIAGIWNLFVGISRVRSVPAIRTRQSAVPQMFEPLAGYIIIGIINLVFGAAIGVVLILVDLYVRDQVLRNRHLFNAA